MLKYAGPSKYDLDIYLKNYHNNLGVGIDKGKILARAITDTDPSMRKALTPRRAVKWYCNKFRS